MHKKIIAVVDDMFFASKIRGTAESLGVKVVFVRSLEQLTKSQTEQPDLIICDLHSRNIDPVLLAETIKGSDQLRSIPLLGFFSHVETQLQRAASEAGFDKVIPRSVFSRDLASILRGE